MYDFQSNKEINLAFNFLQYTDKNIFLTGRAGTGKTTFLKTLVQTIQKRFIILAPTGVAALNAGGVTIHSFFQLPLHCILPNSKFETGKFSKTKINIIRSIDLVIIDEISMVRCDVLDAMDVILKTFRRNKMPFGGVQLLMIGDLNQLPPITTEQEEYMLRAYYSGFYFFYSKALIQSNYITISLQHIYRQSDSEFINILNHIRDNNINLEDINTLNQRYQKDILNNIPSNYIVLCSHNSQVNEINVNKINQLKGNSKIYTAHVEGIFPENSFPNSEKLHLKVGTQVMFLKNDYDNAHDNKKYYNGKIGEITLLDSNFVKVKCFDSEEEIFVQPYTWTNIEYSIDKKTKTIKIKEKGTFTQLPLKLAWAITIHKSQGLTFENAVINSNKAFSHGQVYVALSRCRSLKGMILSEPFDLSSIILDNNVKDFNTNALRSQSNQNQLSKAKEDYFIKILSSIFDFSELNLEINKLNIVCSTMLYKTFTKLSQNIINQLKNYDIKVKQVADKFNSFIIKTYNTNIDYNEKKNNILQRSYKAKDYFWEQLLPLDEIILSLVEVELDNSEYNKKLNELKVSLSVAKEVRVRYLNFLNKEGFSIIEFLEYKNLIMVKGNEIELDSISVGLPNGHGKENKTEKTNIPDDVKDKKLFESLKEWRKKVATNENIPAYMIISQIGLINTANLKPTTIKELLQIKGIGQKKADLYGQEILTIVKENQRNDSD